MALAPQELARMLDEANKAMPELARVLSLAPDQRTASEARILEEARASDNPLFQFGIGVDLHVYRIQHRRMAVLSALLRAAVAYRLDGPAAGQQVTDPASGEPFEYRSLPAGGFELLSQEIMDQEPMSIRVVPSETEN